MWWFWLCLKEYHSYGWWWPPHSVAEAPAQSLVSQGRVTPRLEQTKEPTVEDRTSTRLWNRKKTKGENFSKTWKNTGQKKVRWQWNICTWGDAAAHLPWTWGGSNVSKVKHFLLVGGQKCLLYWSLKNITVLWNWICFGNIEDHIAEEV